MSNIICSIFLSSYLSCTVCYDLCVNLFTLGFFPAILIKEHTKLYGYQTEIEVMILARVKEGRCFSECFEGSESWCIFMFDKCKWLGSPDSCYSRKLWRSWMQSIANGSETNSFLCKNVKALRKWAQNYLTPVQSNGSENNSLLCKIWRLKTIWLPCNFPCNRISN